MRKLITNLFALNYVFKGKNKQTSIPRATFILVPYIILYGTILITLGQILNPVMLPILLLLVWLSFDNFPWKGLGYFGLFPIKRDELTSSQKEQYDKITI